MAKAMTNPEPHPTPATLALLENIQQGMQELEEGDREYFTLLVTTIVRSVVNSSGLVRAVGVIKQALSANDIQGAATIVQSIAAWMDEIELRGATRVTNLLM